MPIISQTFAGTLKAPLAVLANASPTTNTIAEIVGNTGAGAALYIEADDATDADGQLALEVAGGTSGDILAVFTDNASLASAPGNRSRVLAYATIMFHKNEAPNATDVATGTLAFWYDSTAGASALKIAAKDAGGTARTATIALT